METLYSSQKTTQKKESKQKLRKPKLKDRKTSDLNTAEKVSEGHTSQFGFFTRCSQLSSLTGGPAPAKRQGHDTTQHEEVVSKFESILYKPLKLRIQRISLVKVKKNHSVDLYHAAVSGYLPPSSVGNMQLNP